MSAACSVLFSPDSFMTLLILSKGGWNEVKGLCQTHSPPLSSRGLTHSLVSCFHPPFLFFSLNITLSPFLAAVLPNRGKMDPSGYMWPCTLINWVDEGKGAKRTHTHYLLRMVHSEMWSSSLYLNKEDRTHHSVSCQFELLPSPNARIPATCPFNMVLHNVTALFTVPVCKKDSAWWTVTRINLWSKLTWSK